MKLLVATCGESDLFSLLSENSDFCKVVSYNELKNTPMTDFDALAVLGGKGEKPILFDADTRVLAEEFAHTGRPVFLEFVNSFECVYSAPVQKRTHHRLLWEGADREGLRTRDVLDGRYNDFARPYFLMPETEVLMRYHEYIVAHTHAREEDVSDEGEVAFWRCKNVLWCGFRMCDYAKAMFSPQKSWDALASEICLFLTGRRPAKNAVRPVTFGAESVEKCVKKGLAWLERFLVNGGKGGIREGLSHHILPDGGRITADNVRTDCSGEAAGAFLFSGDEKYRGYAEPLFEFVFEKMMVKGGDFDGMLRWTEEAWEVCYQDDAARAMIPALLAAKLGITQKYLPRCRQALLFLSKTAARDGLRRARTDVLEFLGEGKSVFSLAEEESGYGSAHYNAWYSAALILYGQVTGESWAVEEGKKGLETLMSAFPDTVREHSETSELCRLVFPLALLFEATGEEKHKKMLYKVFFALKKLRLPKGGFAEWDTGYKAACSKNRGGECSLLTKNGDPVCDLLYSVNWLPLGFAYGGAVTGDKEFWAEFDGICEFFRSTQTQSKDLLTDGSWSRGWDAKHEENNGAPHDVGWGPCAVESGWTVAETVMGICVGKTLKKQSL